jgi:phosphoglucomutase
MHGVGWAIAQDVALRVNKCCLLPVPEQIRPDPNFPTVTFPNPEEDGALKLAFDTADRAGESIVIANDPDADRFAVAQKVDNTWGRFTGDQVGVLLADYVLSSKPFNDEGRKIAMLCSAVSSSMLKKMIAAAGPEYYFEETLTGFKWIGNRAKQLQDEGYLVVFGYEEALGYMFPEVSWDKDGIAAMSTFLSALSHWRKQGLDPSTKLRQLYQTYGYHESINTYFVSPSPSYTRKVFIQIRNSKAMAQMTFGSYKISKWRDITNGTEVGVWENKLPLDKTSEMLKFHLTDSGACINGQPAGSIGEIGTEIVFTIRASGTEPKVKLYLECSSSMEEVATYHAAHAFSTIFDEWISPFGRELTHSGTAMSSSGREIRVSIG